MGQCTCRYHFESIFWGIGPWTICGVSGEMCRATEKFSFVVFCPFSQILPIRSGKNLSDSDTIVLGWCTYRGGVDLCQRWGGEVTKPARGLSKSEQHEKESRKSKSFGVKYGPT